MAKKKITEIIEEISAEFLAQNGLELYNSEFVKEGRDWFLRVYIDKTQEAQEAQYVSTDDCEKVSRFLSAELDRLSRTTIWKFPHREWTGHCSKIRTLCVLREKS